MIYGIGTDIIEISRIKKAATESFMKRIFTDNEITQVSGKTQSIAGGFAAKEAVSKALGTGFLGFRPIDIEILRDEAGKPYAVLHNKALERFNGINGTKIHVTISHSKDNAVAFVIIETMD